MNKKICVLEDNEEILEIIEIVLREEQYEVFGYGTVSAFMANVGQISPALCLLDVMLPDGNGLEVCSELKSAEETKHIPVIVMTANSRISTMKEVCIANEFIAKPFDIDHLAGTINRLVEGDSLQEAAPTL